LAENKFFCAAIFGRIVYFLPSQKTKFWVKKFSPAANFLVEFFQQN
jgi:hypothetical protein